MLLHYTTTHVVTSVHSVHFVIQLIFQKTITIEQQLNCNKVHEIYLGMAVTDGKTSL